VVTRDQWLAWSAALPAAALIGAVVGLITHSFVTGDGWFHGDMPAPSAAALMEAVRRPDLADVDALLMAGQSPDIREPFADRRLTGDRTFDVSPLFVAVARGDENITALLLASADLGRLENREALCAAAHLNRRDLLRQLLARGVDPADLVCAMYGDLSPADVADARRHDELAADLRGWIATRELERPTLSAVTDISR
jgi:hypothetical protein